MLTILPVRLVAVAVLMIALILPVMVSAQTTNIVASPSSCVNLAHNMQLGSRDARTGGDVSALQNYLIANGYLTGSATGYYGRLTRQAVGSLQISLGILTSSGNLSYGYTGPRTRGAIACNSGGKLSTLPSSGRAPLAVQFTLENLNQSGSSAYTLDFGDGTPGYISTAIGKDTTSHTYTAPGTYSAKLAKNGQVLGVSTIVVTSADSTQPKAIIDPRALITASNNPTIYGTASNTSAVSFVVYPSGSNVVFSSGLLSVSNGAWSGTVTTPLANGTYTVSLHDESVNPGQLLTTGTLTIGTIVSAPTANLTANGQSEITVASLGDTINYAWSSTNGVSAMSSYTKDSADACVETPGTGPFTLNANTLNGTYNSGLVAPCRTGHTYTLTYTVTGVNGQTASDSVIIHVGSLSTISASPNPCTIPSGQSTCTSTISWTVGNNVAATQIWASVPGQAPTLFWCGTTSGSQDASGITTVGTSFNVYRTANCTASIAGQTPDTNTTVKGVLAGVPTTSLTAKGGYTSGGVLTLNVGDRVLYNWSSTNGVSAASVFTKDSPDTCSAAVNAGPFPLFVNSFSGSYVSTPAEACRAGHTYTIAYGVKSATGQTSTSTILIKVLQTPVVNAPTISSVSPVSGTAGSSFTVNGTNLFYTTTLFNCAAGATPANITAQSSTTVTGTVPAMAAGQCLLTLSNPYGSANSLFTITQ